MNHPPQGGFFMEKTMINVRVRQNSIEVSGHAGAAPRGQSVPCAGVSAMTWMLGKGLKEIVELPGFVLSIADGHVTMHWDQLTQSAEDLIDAWFLGLCDIAEEYGCIEFI